MLKVPIDKRLNERSNGPFGEFKSKHMNKPTGQRLTDLRMYFLFHTDHSLDLSFTSSGGEGNDDEELSFSEPPLDDEDDEPLTRPSSGFTPTPSPQPLTSTQKPQGKSEDEKPTEKKDIGEKQRSSSFRPAKGFIAV